MKVFEKTDLPVGWVETNLSYIVSKLVDGSHNPPAKQATGLPMLSAININDNRIIFSSYRLIEEGAFLQEDKRTRIAAGDVLLTIVGAIGRSAIVPEHHERFTLQRSVAVLTPIYVNSKFLMYQFEAPRTARYFKDNARGTAQKGVYLKTLGQTQVSLPPLPEQHRIVAKIEELFSELDKGIESLKTAREQLKVYRQALLKHAFEGKLTVAWREQNQNKLESAEELLKRIQSERAERYRQQVKEWESGGKQGKKPSQSKELQPLTAKELNELPELPKGWGWTTVISACEFVVDCHNKTAPYQSSGIFLVRTSNIRDGKLNLANDIRFVSDNTYEFWSKRCFPRSGDVLFTREAPMGEAAIIPENTKVCMGQRIMLFRQFETMLSSRYLFHAVQEPVFKKRMDSSAIGTGVKHLRVGDVEKLLIPICSHLEQLTINNELDSRLSEVDQLEITITTALQQSETLRKSILKKAFSGQLVPQDPHDEPAAVLLERIRAERNVQDKSSKRQKSSPIRHKSTN